MNSNRGVKRPKPVKLGHQRSTAAVARLAWVRSKNRLSAESASTYLSFVWWIIDPILMCAVYYLVFELVFDAKIENYAIFLVTGLIAWQWFAQSFANSAPSIEHASSLIGQSIFPAVVLPLTVVFASTAKHLVVLTALVFLLTLLGHSSVPRMIHLLPVLGYQLLFVGSMSILIAALVPIVPDLRHLSTNMIRAAMFLSAVVYPLSMVPAEWASVFELNPMVGIIEAHRKILLDGMPFSFEYLIPSLPTNATIMLLSIGTIISLSRRYPRILAER